MYLLDANAFMEASRLYYASDIAPGFWTWLADDSLTGKVGSVEAIKDEITAGTGALVDWANALPASFWLPNDGNVLAAMSELATWAADLAQRFRQEAIDEFLGSADLQLVAHAMAADGTVVTREQPAPDSWRKGKIPDVCRLFDVDWTDPFTTYRELGLRLVC